ncbi:hypothetical protein GAY28_00235 [Azospirillum brasilense]|nr:hypothetical protein [Azospirillum brasilense]
MAEVHRCGRVAICLLSEDLRDQSDAVFEEAKNDLLEFVSLRPAHRSGGRFFRADASSEWQLTELANWREAVEYVGILLGPDDRLVREIAHHPDLAASAPRTADQALSAWSAGDVSDHEALKATGIGTIEDLCIATLDAGLQPPLSVVEQRLRDLEERHARLRQAFPGSETTDSVAEGMLEAGVPVEEVIAELVLDCLVMPRWKAASRIRVDGRRIFDVSDGADAVKTWVSAEVVAAARIAGRVRDSLEEDEVRAAVERGLEIAFRRTKT